jgi:broad specificity phosphatase PhoE
MQGQLDSALDELGVRQTEINGRLLAGFGIESLYSSPLDRARRSAQIISRRLNLPIRYDDRIKEWDCGDWSGYLYQEVQMRWAEEWAALQADRFHYRGPNCENYPDMIERAAPFLQELLTHPARNIAVVSHGVIGRVMIATLLGLDENATLDFRQPNDVLYRVTLADGCASVDHYAAGEGPFGGLVPRE